MYLATVCAGVCYVFVSLHNVPFQFLDVTFTKDNLENIVVETDEWKLLGFLIGDRNAQDDFKVFYTQHKPVGQETCTILIEWQKMHPYASWTLLYQAFIKMNERVMSKQILSKYLSGLLKY